MKTLALSAALNTVLADLSLCVGLVVFSLVLLHPVRSLWPRRLVLLCGQLLAVSIFLAHASYFQYLEATGVALDFPLLRLSLQYLDERLEVLYSESSFWVVIAIVVYFLWILVVPQWLLHRTKVPPRAGIMRAQYLGRWTAAVALALCCFFIACRPMLQGAEASFLSPTPYLAKSWSESRAFLERYATQDVRGTVRNGKGEHSFVAYRDAEEQKRRRIERRSVVIVVMESTGLFATSLDPKMRGKNHGNTTPFLVELGKQGVVATQMRSVIPHTSKCLLAINCGYEATPLTEITEVGRRRFSFKCLPSVLRKDKYRTVFYQSPTRTFENRRRLVSRMGFQRFRSRENFEKASDFPEANYFSTVDDVLLEPIKSFLDSPSIQDKNPFLLTVLTGSPHHDYRKVSLHGYRQFIKSESRYSMRNRYLNLLHHQDVFLRKFVQLFKEAGLYDDTIFIFVGDHGEGFDEHGVSAHDNVIWDEAMRIPFVLVNSGKSPGTVIDEPVNQLDIVPTLMDLLGRQDTDMSYPGTSFFQLSDESRPLYGACYQTGGCTMKVQDGLKLIWRGALPGSELYDLQNDPYEKRNLAPLRPELVRSWSGELNAWVQHIFRRHEL